MKCNSPCNSQPFNSVYNIPSSHFCLEKDVFKWTNTLWVIFSINHIFCYWTLFIFDMRKNQDSEGYLNATRKKSSSKLNSKLPYF